MGRPLGKVTSRLVTVACPGCGAEVGERCFSSTGTRVPSHSARVNLYNQGKRHKVYSRPRKLSMTPSLDSRKTRKPRQPKLKSPGLTEIYWDATQALKEGVAKVFKETALNGGWTDGEIDLVADRLAELGINLSNKKTVQVTLTVRNDNGSKILPEDVVDLLGLRSERYTDHIRINPTDVVPERDIVIQE